ncbi:restriction endonuclease [Helicobacter sp. L8]|uniref:restriction endonuclease n=1 Tax=Helicobacter sp. L8 TaxID=2316078 RepID=UPI000EB01851|nr:restriction endonuclease [Helicobacter sp. L8]
MDCEDILEDLITQKHTEIKGKQERGKFDKILQFEGNAMGQVGEKFVKEVFRVLRLPLENLDKEVIHDEFDLLSGGKKIEIKTARKGLNHNTFQFNGINPIYNYDYIILIGITPQSAHYYIVDKKQDYRYDHKSRKHLVRIHSKEKQLVAMNPGNQTNYKLTLTLEELKQFSRFKEALRAIFTPL